MGRVSHEKAFTVYLLMGPDRSYAKVAEEMGCSTRTIEKYASQHGWQQQLQEEERKEAEELAQDVGAGLTELKRRLFAMNEKVLANAHSQKRVPVLNADGTIKKDEHGNDVERLVETVDIVPQNVHELVAVQKQQLHLAGEAEGSVALVPGGMIQQEVHLQFLCS